jgi:hypothetical protein
VRGDEPGESAAFDQAIKGLVTGGSRREILRGVIAAFAVVAGGGIATSAMAKNRKNAKKAKRQKKRAQNKTPQTPQTPQTPICPRGTSLTFLSVPADGSVVSTPVLETGRRYLLRADGFWVTSGNENVDAFASYPAGNPSQPVLSKAGVRLGLSVDGGSPDLWGAYSLTHRYEMEVIGQGRPVSLMMFDSDYSENSRLLTVEVACGTP